MNTKSLLTLVTRISSRSASLIRFNTTIAATRSSTPIGQLITAANSVVNTNKNFVKQYSTSDINIPIVSYEEIKQLPKQPHMLLIDVREPQELQETGQIPTSINIPLGQVAEELGPNVDKGAFKAKYGRDKPENNTEIIFHCKIGRRSNSAAELARTLGYQNTKNYLGSWTEWAEKEGLPK